MNKGITFKQDKKKIIESLLKIVFEKIHGERVKITIDSKTIPKYRKFARDAIGTPFPFYYRGHVYMYLEFSLKCFEFSSPFFLTSNNNQI